MDLQRLFIIVLVLAVIGGGYYYFQSSSSSPMPSSNATIKELDARLSEMRPLQALTVDVSIFDNAFFQSLKLVTPTPKPTITPGRPNPFAPL